MKVRLQLFALLTGALSMLGQSAAAQQLTPTSTATPTEAQRLEPGKPVEGELKAGETHRYTVALTKGQFLDAAVNQRDGYARPRPCAGLPAQHAPCAWA